MYDSRPVGRPRKNNAKSEQIVVRLTKAELNIASKFANRLDISLSDYVREAIMEKCNAIQLRGDARERGTYDDMVAYDGVRIGPDGDILDYDEVSEDKEDV